MSLDTLIEPPVKSVQAQSWTVLCVDDEPNILSALRRALRPENCRVLTAASGAEALSLMASEAIDVVLSDMRMPQMDGAQLLSILHRDHPDVMRILLTGYADMNATVAAINEGHIYRYIHKPWDENELRLTVRQAYERRLLEQERARLLTVTAEQNESLRRFNTELEHKVQERTQELETANEQLKRKYLQSVKMFASLMELRAGIGTGHGKRSGELARKLAQQMGMSQDEIQDLLVAGLLHDLGFMALPDHVLTTPVGRLSDEALAQYRRHPVIGAQAFMSLDTHQAVADTIRSHHERYDGQGFPDGLAGSSIPLPARILSVVSTYDDLMRGHLTGVHLSEDEARQLIKHGRGQQFDPEVTDLFLQLSQPEPSRQAVSRKIGLAEARAGMVLAKDLLSHEGLLLLSAGQALTDGHLRRLHAYQASEETFVTLSIKP